MHRALCVFGQLEAAADALHHLLFLISPGEATAATAAANTLADKPANQSLKPQALAPIRPHSHSFRPPATAEQSEGLSDSCETAGASVLPAQTQSDNQAELNQQQSSGETTIVDNSRTTLQPAAQRLVWEKPLPQHLLQNQSPRPTPSQPHGPPPSGPPASDQLVAHQLMHSQQAMSVRQSSLLQEPQHSRETSRHAELLYYQLKLIREACHTVMTLAEKRGQPALMLPLLESMQQVSSSHTLSV